MRNRARSSKGGVTTAESGVTSMPTVGMERRNRCTKYKVELSRSAQAVRRRQCRQINVGAKEVGLIESVQEDSEMGWLFMNADAMSINQLSMDGAHSLVVDSGSYVHVCPKSYAAHATLQSLPERWRGLDLRSASGKMLKVWVAYNALDLHGRVFTVKIPFVVCEVRRPLLSLAMLEDKGFHMTVKDGCQKLGGHGREMNLRRQGNSHLVDVEFRGGLLEKSKEIGSPPGLVAPVDSGVAALSATAGVDETSSYHCNTRSAQS